jgi:hypothetical protein
MSHAPEMQNGATHAFSTVSVMLAPFTIWIVPGVGSYGGSDLGRRQSRFLRGDFGAFHPQVETDPAENAHVYVGDPHQCETGNQVSAPIRVQQLEAGYDEENHSNVMAETVFAGKQIEEFALVDASARLALASAIVAEFADEFLMCDGPRNGRNGKRQYKQIQYL